jgi:hypothetical protein
MVPFQSIFPQQFHYFSQLASKIRHQQQNYVAFTCYRKDINLRTYFTPSNLAAVHTEHTAVKYTVTNRVKQNNI